MLGRLGGRGLREVGRLKFAPSCRRLCDRASPYMTGTIIVFKKKYDNVAISGRKLVFAGRRYNFNSVRRLDDIRRSCLGSNFISRDGRRRLPIPNLAIHCLHRAISIDSHVGSRVTSVGRRRLHLTTTSSVKRTVTSSMKGARFRTTSIIPFCGGGGCFLVICSIFGSIHVMFTPPDSIKGFNNSASG